MDRKEAKARAIELVGKMTVEEAASQLRFDAPAIERLGIPEYNWWNEALHGVARAGTATVFPQAIGLAATFDKELLTEIGEAIAIEGRAKYNAAVRQGDRDIYKGLTFWAPNVNIFRDPRWGRGHETYGEDPYLTAKMGCAFIKGLQKKTEDGYLYAAACAKHFAVHSGPEAERHHFDAVVSKKDLFETYLPAFEHCVKDAGVEAVMGAYNRTNHEPCCGHQYLIQDVLRGEWGFEGHFVSDCWAVKDFHEHHHVTDTPEESVKLALEAGCDVNCGCTYQKVMNAYHAGMISRETIDQAAVRLFTTRFMLGMFDKTRLDEIPYTEVESKKHLKLSEKAAYRSCVLLENDGILPFSASGKTIAVIGPNADSRKALMGNYYGTAGEYITVLEGIRREAPEDCRILYAEGCHLYKEKPDGLSRPYNQLAEAKEAAENADVVVLCLGLDESLEGEEGDAGNAYASGDKMDLELPKTQKKLLETIADTGKPLIVVIMAGSALNLRYAKEHASALLQAWYPGARGGKALAEILFGKAAPGGRLPITIYESAEDLPDFTDYSMKNRTYRYMEKEPLYPFGYGLNYADTRLLSADFSETSFKKASKNGIKIKAVCKNESDFPAEEVVQVYIHVNGTDTEVRNKRLVSFERFSLMAGEEKENELAILKEAFETVDAEGIRGLYGTSAEFVIRISGGEIKKELAN